MERGNAMSGMNEIASMDRTSGFVRTLVRMQLSQNRRSSRGAMDRLYERMKERGEDVDFNSAPKVSRRTEVSHTSEQSSTEDDDDAGVQVTRSAHGKRSVDNATDSGKRKELLRTSTGGFLYNPRRRSPISRTPSPSKAEEDTKGHQGENKVYTFGSANHSVAMNRGLTLAESVKKNYSRYIRTEKVETQDEKGKDRKDPLLTEQRQLNPQIKEVSFVEIRVPDSRKVDTLPSVPSLKNPDSRPTDTLVSVSSLVNSDSRKTDTQRNVPSLMNSDSRKTDTQLNVPSLMNSDSRKTDTQLNVPSLMTSDSRKTAKLLSVPSLMNRSSSSLGLITTIEEDLPGEMPRSNSALSVPICASLPATTDGAQMQATDSRETHAAATRAQRSRKGKVKKTEGRFRRRSSSNQEDRAVVIKELHKAHSLMDEHTKEVLLKKAKARNEAYKREQQLRERKMAIFKTEMDDVMKRLRDINNRLDCRLRILDREEALGKLES